MCEDYLKKHDIIKSTNMLLIELEKILELEGYNLEQFKLPTPNHNEESSDFVDIEYHRRIAENNIVKLYADCYANCFV